MRPEREELFGDLADVLWMEEQIDGVVRERDPRLDVGEAGSIVGGRGLQLVNALAAEWGVSPRADGKAVWAAFPLPVDWPNGVGCPCSGAGTIILASGRKVRDRA